MKMKLISVAIALAGTFFLSACTTTVPFTVNYSALGIKMYSGKAPIIGKKYTSLGVIQVRKQRAGFASFGFGQDGFFSGGYAVNNLSKDYDRLEGEIQEELARGLVTRANELGANAILNVRYFVIEGPVLFPLFGPLTIKTYHASGEAVRL